MFTAKTVIGKRFRAGITFVLNNDITNSAKKLSFAVGILWEICAFAGDFAILFDKTA